MADFYGTHRPKETSRALLIGMERKTLFKKIKKKKKSFVCCCCLLNVSSCPKRIGYRKSRNHSREFCHFVPNALISTVINKVMVCGKGIKYVMSQAFLLFFGEERTNMAGPGRVQIRSKNNNIKRTYFCLINDRVTRGSMQMKIFSTLSGQLPSSVWFPFNLTMNGGSALTVQ